MSGNEQEAVARATGCQKSHYFLHTLAIFWSAEKRRKDTFFHPPSPFRCNSCKRNSKGLYCFLQTQLLKGLYCLKQRLLRNRLRSGSCDLSRLLARKITKGVHSCKPASPSNPIIISSTLLPSSVITGYATEGARLQIISARHSYAVRAIRKV